MFTTKKAAKSNEESGTNRPNLNKIEASDLSRSNQRDRENNNNNNNNNNSNINKFKSNQQINKQKENNAFKKSNNVIF